MNSFIIVQSRASIFPNHVSKKFNVINYLKLDELADYKMTKYMTSELDM